MRIALSFPGCHRRGGAERVMVECVNFLATRGHEVHVLASDIDTRDLEEGIATHLISGMGLWAGLDLEVFKRRSQRVLQSLGSKLDVSAGFGVTSPDGSVAWLPSVHGEWLRISGRGSPFWQRIRRRCNPFHYVVLHMERRMFKQRRHKLLIVLSQAERRALRELYGVPEKDVEVLPNGYSAEEFRHDKCMELRPKVRQSLGYATEDRVILFVANEVERKGLPQLLSATARLRDPRVKLLLAGQLDANWIEREVRRCNLGDKVQFIGPSNNVAQCYAAADIFALPTKYDAWGLVIVEAMACGLPVLTSRYTGASVAVKDGVTGVLVDDPSDIEEIEGKLARLLDGQHTSPASIAESVREYCWDTVLLRYEAMLEGCRELGSRR